ncbi:MAG: SseB family protein, partial [Lachnospiraceae bacterium]|nr:SseB family protein [Lachnospiraceae bacterium]
FAEEVRDRLPDDLLAIFNQEQKLKDALKARWDVDTTIAAHNASPSTESMNKVLNALSVRMKAGGLLYIPVEHIGAEAVDKYTPIPIPKPGEQVARRSIATNDGKRWVVAFTSEEELKKKENEPTEYLGEPAVFTFQMASRIPDCAGLAINPWGERFFMSQDLINRFMELTIHPKKPEA